MTDHQQPIDRWRTRRARALRLLREEGLRGLTQRFEDKGAWPFLKEKVRFQLCSTFERAWDTAHRVDTSGQIDLENLEVIGENRSFGYSVVSTSPQTFSFLARLFPAEKSKYTFIDVGCGKGCNSASSRASLRWCRRSVQEAPEAYLDLRSRPHGLCRYRGACPDAV